MLSKARKVRSDEVQGPGSYVVLKRVRVSPEEARMVKTYDIEHMQPLLDFFEGYLARVIVKWNWVNDEGRPLPLPKEDPKVIGELNMDELYFIIRKLGFKETG